MNENLDQLQKLVEDPANPLAGVRLIGVGNNESDWTPDLHSTIEMNCNKEQLLQAFLAEPTLSEGAVK